MVVVKLFNDQRRKEDSLLARSVGPTLKKIIFLFLFAPPPPLGIDFPLRAPRPKGAPAAEPRSRGDGFGLFFFGLAPFNALLE